MTTVFTTSISWMGFTFLVFTNYFDACTWLLALDIWINMICVYLMFGFNKNYYIKCVNCVPFGRICSSLVHWIELCHSKKLLEKQTAEAIFNNVPNEPMKPMKPLEPPKEEIKIRMPKLPKLAKIRMVPTTSGSPSVEFNI